MKSILMSIKPKWVAKILNGEKTIEIRKRFPSDYVGWVYIYCTKGNKNTCLEYADNPDMNKEGKWYVTSGYPYANGKVVARFWCDKVEEINKVPLVVIGNYLKNACLSVEELQDYSRNYRYKTYAIHITKLETFDKPKEINDFYKAPDEKYAKWCRENSTHGLCIIQSLTRAPQNYCYVRWFDDKGY